MMPLMESNLERKLVVTSVEQNIWDDLRSNSAAALDRLELRPLLEPTVFLLHQMIVHSIKALHYNVFKQIILNDFGFSDIDHEVEFDAMFENEINEHG